MSACQHYIAIHVNAWKWFDFFTFDAMGKAARLPELASLWRTRCRRRLRRTRNRIGSTSAEQPSLETDSSVRRDSSIPAAEGRTGPWQCVSESITWYSVSSSTDQIETLGVRRDSWEECSGGGF